MPFTQKLQAIFMKIVRGLGNIASPDQAPGNARRDEGVNNVLDNFETTLIHIAACCGIKEGVVTAYLGTLRSHVRALAVAVGDFNERHPSFFPLLALSIVAMLIPESFILNALGFGPLGPVRGSIAAFLQSTFYGAAVESGSLFAVLQGAGMGVIPAWFGVVTKGPLIIGGLTGAVSGLLPASAESD